MSTKNKEAGVEASKNNKKRNTILIVVGLLLIIILFLIWFFNRKFEVTFDYNNGTKDETILVKYNKMIDKENIKTKEDLGEQFIDWYLILETKDNKDVLDENPFDFETKINKNIKLKALYEAKVETITITFDSKGGSKIAPITINKGSELTLPKNPTYSGYTFTGWVDKNSNPIYDKALLSEDTTLYAVWKKNAVNPTKKEEKISLSLSNYYIHRSGTKTSNAIAKTENTSGKVTYSMSQSRCASIDPNTGVITALNVQKTELTYCATNGETLKVTATLPSGKSASQTIYVEKDLVLTVGSNEFYVFTKEENRYFKTGSNDFTVKANQNVKWTTNGTVNGSVLTNSTTCSGKVDHSNSSVAPITAATTGGQKITVYCMSVVN